MRTPLADRLRSARRANWTLALNRDDCKAIAERPDAWRRLGLPESALRRIRRAAAHYYDRNENGTRGRGAQLNREEVRALAAGWLDSDPASSAAAEANS